MPRSRPYTWPTEGPMRPEVDSARAWAQRCPPWSISIAGASPVPAPTASPPRSCEKRPGRISGEEAADGGAHARGWKARGWVAKRQEDDCEGLSADEDQRQGHVQGVVHALSALHDYSGEEKRPRGCTLCSNLASTSCSTAVSSRSESSPSSETRGTYDAGVREIPEEQETSHPSFFGTLRELIGSRTRGSDTSSDRGRAVLRPQEVVRGHVKGVRKRCEEPIITCALSCPQTKKEARRMLPNDAH